MAKTPVLWKGSGSAHSGNPGGSRLLLPGGVHFDSAQVVDANGNVVENLNPYNPPRVHEAGETSGGEFGQSFISRRPGVTFGNNFIVKVTQNGKPSYIHIANGGGTFRGYYDETNSSIDKASSIASTGTAGGGGNAPNSMMPGQIGKYGYYPAYLGNQFPNPVMMPQTPYTYTDPMEYAQKYGDFNRGEIKKNYDVANEIALKELDTELTGMKSFVPAAAALKRSETSLDNTFNQSQRTSQLDAAMPGARADLDAQAARARAYASGRAPDEVTDRALELNVRSAAADRANAGGFGASSSVARKTSDLMSADKRIALSQYGDQLLTNNIGTKANLELAPTEYSNAGSQVNAMPSVSGSQLAAQNQSEVNSLTMVPTTSALSATVQQNQFTSSQEQQRSMYNTGTANQFGLTKFQYDTGYAAAVAGAAQTNSNTETALTQQAQASQIYQQYMQKSQDQGTISSIASGAGTIAGVAGALGSITDAFKTSPAQTTTTTGTSGGGSSSGSSSGGVNSDGSFSTIPTNNSGNSASSSGETVVAPSNDTGNVEVAPSDNNTTPVANTGDSFSMGNTNSGSGGSGSDVVPPPQDTGPSAGYNEDYYKSQQNYAASVANLRSYSTDTGMSHPAFDTAAASGGGGTGGGGSYGGDTAQSVAETLPENNNDTTATSTPAATNTPTTAQQAAVNQANTPLNGAGMSYVRQPGYVLAGYNRNGVAVYTQKGIAQSQDTSLGGHVVSAITNSIVPMNVLTASDKGALDKLGAAASSVSNLATLTQLATTGDAKGFVNFALNTVGRAAVNSGIKDEKTKNTANVALSAYNLFTNWNRMSPAQKALGVATLGVSSFQTSKGNLLGDINLVPKTSATPSVNVGQALNMLNAGVNVYSMINNWHDMNAISKIASGTSTLASVANIAKGMGLLGTGENGAAVSAQGLAQVNNLISTGAATAAPHVGTGAIALSQGTALPEGYSVVSTQGGQVIAAPTSNLSSVCSTLGTVAGVASIAAGAYQVYKGWGMGGEKGAVNGLLGGGAIAAGTSMLLTSNPYTLGAIVAFSTVSNMIKTGKSDAQNARDAVREGPLTKLGVVDKNFNVTLADGTVSNITALDGHGGYHAWSDASKVTASQKDRAGKSLNVWDIDYTNDLDYMAGMGGSALSRLVSGGKGTGTDQVGGQLGNAAISNIGYGKEMSEANFNKATANLRTMYAKAGIATKQDAFALSNQMAAEGRISQADLVSMQQSFNMIYDGHKGFQDAQTLMAGRWAGVEEAGKQAGEPESTGSGSAMPKSPSKDQPQSAPGQPSQTKLPPGAAAPQSPAATSSGKTAPAETAPGTAAQPTTAPVPKPVASAGNTYSIEDAVRAGNYMPYTKGMTKDQIKAANRQKFIGSEKTLNG